MKHVNRNLSLQASLGLTPDIYLIDGDNGHVYGMEDCRLIKRGSKLEPIESYDKALSLGMYEAERLYGVSFQTDTALIVLGDGRQAFYNLSNNKFSSKIRVGRVIPSSHDGKWYCFDYSKKDRKLWLRDIAQDIHAMLEWREFFLLRAKRATIGSQSCPLPLFGNGNR